MTTQKKKTTLKKSTAKKPVKSKLLVSADELKEMTQSAVVKPSPASVIEQDLQEADEQLHPEDSIYDDRDAPEPLKHVDIQKPVSVSVQEFLGSINRH